LKNVVSGLIKEYVACHVIEYKQCLYVCVINIGKDEDQTALRSALHNIIQTFGYDFTYCRISIGIGGVCRGLPNLTHSFNEAMTALQMRTDEKQFQIIDSQQLSIQHNFYYSFVEENKIANLLKLREMEQLEQAVRTIVQTNREKGVSHQSIQLLFSELFNTGCKYAADKGVDIKQLISASSQAQLRGQADLALKDEDKIVTLLEFYRKLTDVIAKEEKKTLPLVSVIIKYIEENYGQDLYLEKLSEEFGVSSKYISRIFKEQTGTNLTDYISMIRIAKAKQLLLETDLPISEIGEKIGIFNRTTFLRTFKKFEGVSPMEYRHAAK
jgi:YesN/AraC family two-component response regulator